MFHRFSRLTLVILLVSSAWFMSGCSGTTIREEVENRRPDIIWIMAEDISIELSCYGEAGVSTPHIDQLAAEGTRYERAYCSGPACSTSRSGMMSGIYQTRMDAHDHRRIGNATVPTFPEALRTVGYFNALGAGYSDKTDLNFTPTGKVFDGSDWSEAQEGQPTFTQLTLDQSHRKDAAGTDWMAKRENSTNPVDLQSIELPPYFPDIPEVREDWAIYLDQIQYVDGQVGEIIARLKKENRYDDAMIIFCGDNGRCHLRAKNWLYEPGLKVPLIIKWPKGERAGEVVKNMVSMLDVTATVLDVAGAQPIQSIDGRSLAGNKPHTQDFIFGAKDASGEVQDHIRSVCDGRWKYIRNYMPEPGYVESKYTVEHRPMLAPMKQLGIEGQLTDAQLMVIQKPKPLEELYDLENDPHEIHNLANDPQHAAIKATLVGHLDAWIEETNDTGLQGISWWGNKTTQPPTPQEKYILEWQDEFTGNTLNTSLWAYREDNKHQSIQRRENVSVADGALRLDLRVHDEPIEGKTASGAGIVSNRRFHYGWYEVRARLGNGTGQERGWHHSFWAMAAEVQDGKVATTNPGIRRTEIDCFENPTEHLYEPEINGLNKFVQHVIVWNDQGTEWGRLPKPPADRTLIPGFDASEWHTYAFEWTPEKINFYVDGQITQVANYPAGEHVHDEVNVWLTAISANWNHQGDQIPSKAEYDYFRFYHPAGDKTQRP